MELSDNNTMSTLLNATSDYPTHVMATSVPPSVDTINLTAGCALYDLLVCGVIVGASCLLGLVGNAAAVAVLHADRRRSVTAFLLTALAAADSAFLLPVATLTVPAAVCRFRPAWCAGAGTLAALRVIDRYGWAVASTAHTLTVYVTVLVTWQRYIAVCRPHAAAAAGAARTLTLARRRICAVAFFAILYNLPRFLEFHVDVNIKYEYANKPSPTTQTGICPNSTANRSIGNYTSDGEITISDSNFTQKYLTSTFSNMLLSLGFPPGSLGSTDMEQPLSSSMGLLSRNSFLSARLLGSPHIYDRSLVEHLTASTTLSSISTLSSIYPSPIPDGAIIQRTWLHTTRTLTEVGRSPWYQILYKNVCFYVFIYVIPLITLVILTTRLAQALHKRKLRFQSRQASVRSRREDGTTLVLIVVVVVFIICQTPTLFQRLFYAVFGDAGLRCGHFFYYFEKLADYFAVLNSCVNFIIYIMFSRQFRQVLWTNIRRKGKRRRKQPAVNNARMAWENGNNIKASESIISNGEVCESLGSVV